MAITFAKSGLSFIKMSGMKSFPCLSSKEANRLNQRIDIEKAILAFMLYDAEGNIGQVKRDHRN